MRRITWHLLHLLGVKPQWESQLLQKDEKLQKFNSAAQSGLCGCPKKWDELYINRIKFIKGWK